MSSENEHRKKRMSTALSFIRRISNASASIRSRGSSVLSKFQKELTAMQEPDTIQWREWLFALVECMLAFSWNCIGAREKLETNMAIKGLTPRQDTMNTLFWLGIASFGNIIVGQLMDCLTGYYLMPLVNVVLHFSLACFFLIVEIIHETSDEDVYAHLLSNAYLAAFVPVKALGFTRYVYAMDQVGFGKGTAFIVHYTFIFNLFNLAGDFLYIVVQDTGPSSGVLSAVAFCFNGTVLFLYAYLFRPVPRMPPPPPRSSAIKIWGVLFTALRNMSRFRGKAKRIEWLDYADSSHTKQQIARSRRIFRLLLVITPTTGFLLFTTFQEIIFKEFYDNLRFSGPDVPKYVKWIIPISSLMAVICVEYVLLPLIGACNYKVTFLKRFVLGYMSMILAITVVAVITMKTEKLAIRPGSGTFRIYNTMEGSVSFVPVHSDFTDLNFSVPKNRHYEASFEASEPYLFTMAVTFVNQRDDDDTVGNMTTYVQMFSVVPGEVLQFVTIAPSTIIRLDKYLPVKEGPPGKNDGRKPRCFIASLFGDVTQSVYLTNDKTFKQRVFDVGPGEVVVFQVEEGSYTFRYEHSLSVRRNSEMGEGGLYGIYLFLGLKNYEIEVDTVIPQNTIKALTALAVDIPMTLAKFIGQVSLDAFVFASAPEGLKGLAYGFYLLCIHSAAWFILLGFYTWHHYITPNIILVYALLALVSFIICLVLLVRYKNHYVM